MAAATREEGNKHITNQKQCSNQKHESEYHSYVLPICHLPTLAMEEGGRHNANWKNMALAAIESETEIQFQPLNSSDFRVPAVTMEEGCRRLVNQKNMVVAIRPLH